MNNLLTDDDRQFLTWLANGIIKAINDVKNEVAEQRNNSKL